MDPPDSGEMGVGRRGEAMAVEVEVAVEAWSCGGGGSVTLLIVRVGISGEVDGEDGDNISRM